MNKDTKLSAFNQLFQPFFHEGLAKKLEEPEADKYVKKLTTIRLIQLVAYAQIRQDGCLREISNNFHILKDQLVYLGNNHTKMTHPVRLIEVLDTKGERIVIITNDFRLTAEAIGDIYRHRLADGTLFQVDQTAFQRKTLLRASQPAVENQLYIALCSYCLLMPIKLETGFIEQ